MKMKKLIYALGIGCTLCACSSNDEPNVQEEQKDFTKSNKYVSVAIVTSNDGTRAASDYEDGLDNEYDVNGVGFYFFDRQGNCVDTEYKTSVEFTQTGASNHNPAVTVVGTVEVELAANRVYDSVIAILNPNSDLMNGNNLKSKSKNEVIAYFADYSGDQKTADNKGNFTMSNSVYIDNVNYKGTGDFTSAIAVPITSHNIYTKDGKTEAELQTEITEKAVNIYVERVCAKVIVDTKPAFTGYFVDKEGKETEIGVLFNVNGESVEKKIKIIPEFQGIGMSVTSSKARLIKNLSASLTYKFNEDITSFVWNDVNNKRTYWESTIGESTEANGGGFNYTKWDDLANVWETDNDADYIEYINPNTDASTMYDIDEATKNTKLLVRAQLKYKPEGQDEAQPLDLVKFSGGYWMADYLLYHAAQRAFEDLANLDYSTLTDATKLASAKEEVAKITRDAIKAKLSLVRQTTGMAKAYLAKLSIKNGKDEYPDLLSGMAAGDDKTILAALVNAQIQQTLDDISNRQIQYWKEGMTYFYVPIRHEGFTGLTGTGTQYLNGVVRNHVYKINISKIWGLGTPVIDPEEPIDPERPEDAPDSYMTAKIHVLKWRIVSSNVTMH